MSVHSLDQVTVVAENALQQRESLKKRKERSVDTTSPDLGGDIGNEENRTKYKIGSYVWARVTGHPWWPAKVVKAVRRRLFVSFYGVVRDDDKWGWIRDCACKPFKEEKISKYLRHFSEGKRKKKASQIIKAIKEIQQEVELSSDLNDSREEICFECGLGGLLICCDDCTNVCHLECAVPKLKEIPKDNWYCRECIQPARKRLRSSHCLSSEITTAASTLTAVFQLSNQQSRFRCRDTHHIERTEANNEERPSSPVY